MELIFSVEFVFAAVGDCGGGDSDGGNGGADDCGGIQSFWRGVVMAGVMMVMIVVV